MSFFGDNKSKIINNLLISNKLYYVANYLDSEETTEPDGTIKITINIKSYAMNNSGKETNASASLSGSTNTTNGVGNFYVRLLDDAVKLIYQLLLLLYRRVPFTMRFFKKSAPKNSMPF